jgi:hypothetical protein
MAVRWPSTNSRAYRKALSQYRFVASPPGNGVDCHRTWEAFYLRVVPIVVRSVLTEEFESWGLPVWLVDDYRELQDQTEADLNRRYIALEARFQNPLLTMDEWKRKIFGPL